MLVLALRCPTSKVSSSTVSGPFSPDILQSVTSSIYHQKALGQSQPYENVFSKPQSLSSEQGAGGFQKGLFY